jgi:hypothetical protein
MPKNDAQVRVAITALDDASAPIRQIGWALDSLVGNIQGVGSALSAMSMGSGLGMFAGAAAGAAELAKSTADYEVSIYRASQVTHVSAENLSGLKVTTDETGESFDSLTKTLGKLGKSIGEAFDKPSSEAGKVLSALFNQTEIDSLKLAPVDERIQKVVKALFDLKDPNDQQLAMSILLSKGWQSNAETLRELADGYGPLIEKAKALNECVDPEHAKAANDYEKAWTHLKDTWQGVAHELGEDLIPLMTALFKMAVPQDDSYWKQMNDRADALKARLESAKKHPVYTEDQKDVEGYNEYQQGIANDTKELAGIEAWIAAQKAASEAYVKNAATAKDARDKHQALVDALNHEVKAHKEAAEAADTYRDPLAKLMQPIITEAQELGMTTDQIKLYTLAMAGMDQADENFIARLLTKIDAFHANKQALAEWKSAADAYQQSLKTFGDQIRDEVATPAEQAQQRLSMLSQALGARQISPETYKRAVTKTQDDLDHQKEDADEAALGERISKNDALAVQFGQDMGHTFDSLIMGSKNFTATLEQLILKLAETLIQIELFKPLADSFGGATGGLLGSMFSTLAGGRAGGGDVNYGQSYMIGEEGPEIFTPNVPGTITPNSALQTASGDGGVHYDIDARGADAGVEYRVMRAIAAGNRQAAISGYMLSREMAKRGA